MNKRWMRFLALRRKGVSAKIAQRVLGGVEPPKSFVADVEWHRAEELRADMIGVPSEDEIREDRPHDPWRPSRTLGKLPRF